MKRFMSILVMIGLVVPNLALADQGVVVERTPGYWFSYAEKLPIGSTVRVRTTDGKRQTAVLALVDRDGITIELKSRIPEPARRIGYNEIQQLELKTNGASMVKAAAIGAAIGAGAFVGLLALLAASWD
ncbi:MAG TPA: hypothetical protein VM115_12720 [Vicinamibacterales bacterium]|nr:hypothetical protein [Vicinamibacterales bacterium]